MRVLIVIFIVAVIGMQFGIRSFADWYAPKPLQTSDVLGLMTIALIFFGACLLFGAWIDRRNER